MRKTSMLVVALALASAAAVLPRGAKAQAISQEGKAGAYAVTLKVLPAEAFVGKDAEMVRDSGAKAITIGGPMHPDHHLVAFIASSGKPVEHARVSISYRRTGTKMPATKWMKLPVARMHVKGKSLATTHFGNNVRLAPGDYEARVTVNGKSAMFHFTLPGERKKK